MALYRYVASKDELHQLMLDAVVDPQEWVLEGEDCREGIQQWARILADGYARHPWALDIPLHADIMLMPGQVRGADAALRSLRPLSGDPGEKLLVISILTVYVRGFAALSCEMHGGGGAPGRPERELLGDIARTGELPDLAALITSGVYFEDQEAPGPSEDEFSSELALLLPRIEEHFAQHAIDALPPPARRVSTRLLETPSRISPRPTRSPRRPRCAPPSSSSSASQHCGRRPRSACVSSRSGRTEPERSGTEPALRPRPPRRRRRRRATPTERRTGSRCSRSCIMTPTDRHLVGK